MHTHCAYHGVSSAHIHHANHRAYFLRITTRICTAHLSAYIHCADHCAYLLLILPPISTARTIEHIFCAWQRAYVLRILQRMLTTHTNAHIHCAYFCAILQRLPTPISSAQNNAHIHYAYFCAYPRFNQIRYRYVLLQFDMFTNGNEHIWIGGKHDSQDPFPEQCLYIAHSPSSRKYNHTKQCNDTHIHSAYHSARLLRTPSCICTAEITAHTIVHTHRHTNAHIHWAYHCAYPQSYQSSYTMSIPPRMATAHTPIRIEIESDRIKLFISLVWDVDEW